MLSNQLLVILCSAHGTGGGVAGMIAGGAAAAAAAYGAGAHHGHGHGHGGQGGYVHNAAGAMGIPGFSGGHGHGKFKHGKHGHGKFKQGKHGMLKKHGFKKWK